MSAVALSNLNTRTTARRPRQQAVQAPIKTGKVSVLPIPARADREQPIKSAAEALPVIDASNPPNSRDIDQALVLRAQAGQEIAFELLVRKYQNRVIQLVQRLVGEADAPDVAQEAFLKTYRALGNFRGECAFYTWLYRVAINTAKNHLVARSRRPASQDVDEAEKYGYEENLCDFATPEACLLADEIKLTVAGVIGKLSADLRGAIIMREMEGLSYEDIAQVMDCPIGTVRSRIFRAREAIDQAVNPLLAND